MSKYLIFLVSIIFFCTCKENSKRKYKTITRNGITTKGYVLNDSLFEDTVFYYSQNDILLRKEFFKNGIKEGLSTEYYPNGIPRMQTYYSAGLKNGENSYFDTLGKCFYKDNYYYGLVVGQIIYFDSTESPKRYFFANLQNETLFDIEYKSWKGISDFVSNCINYTFHIQRSDTTHEGSLLLYLINPPKFSFKYSIFKINKNSEKEIGRAHV